MITFIFAVIFLLSTPGPGVLSAAGVGAGFGMRAGLRFVSGLFIGQAIVFFSVAFGLATLVLATPWLRIFLMALSFSYLLYLAGRITLAGSKIAFISLQSAPGFLAGVLLQPINPKAYAVLTTLLAGFPLVPESYWTEVALKFAVLNMIWIPIHLAWVYFGVSFSNLNLPKSVQRNINFAMAVSMLAIVALATWAMISGSQLPT